MVSATDSDIQAYLDRVLESGSLGRGARRPALLKYLLNAELDGEGGNLKAYSIGVDVFEKPEGFDPTTDSSVRVEVGRLRTSLSLFEASEYADTRLLVKIPVGTYRPEIHLRANDPSKAEKLAGVEDQRGDPARATALTSPATRNRPSILVQALLAISVLIGLGFLVSRWPSEPVSSSPPIRLTVQKFEGELLGQELSRLVQDGFANTKVVSVGRFDEPQRGSDDFEVTGNITKLNDVVWVGVELSNMDSSEVVWNHIFQLDPSADLRSEIDTKLNGELETRLIGAAKVLLEKRKVQMLTPEQLFILGTWVSGPAISSLEWETERVTLMKLALEKDPDFGPAHSVLADKYGFLANMHPEWDTDESLALSRYHADRAIELSPLDSNAMFNVAQSFWHAGRHAESQRMFIRVTELDGGNSLARFFAKVLPFWCDSVPDDVMDWALSFDRNLSQDDPIRWIVLTWIGTLHTNRGEYNLALQAADDASKIFQVGYTYMLHAMLLHKVGQPSAALAAVEQQYGNWPGISIEHYVSSSIPRLCTEQNKSQLFLKDYADFAAGIAGRD